MRRQPAAFWVLPFLCGILFLTGTATRARTDDPLQSLSVVRFFFSDDLSAWNHTILDVTPVGKDVRVRLIQLALANPSCGALLVRAVEHVFPRTTVARVARTDVCSHTERSVEAALASATKSSTITEAASQVVIARCGVRDKVFVFPYDALVDQKALQRSNPGVASLLEMIYRVRDRAFGKSFWFSRTTPELEMELEDLGLKLVPELISGKYQAAFAGWECSDQTDRKCVPNYLASRLEGYRVPPREERGLLPPELVEQASLPLTKYVRARYPSIAASARVSGDVRLSIAADPQTGAVTNVEVVNGSPLLSQAAVEAAQSWQFAPAFLTGQPLEATLRFQLRCWGE